MLREKLKGYKLILASRSPRREELLKGLDIDFEIKPIAVEERFPGILKGEEIALYLSKLKAGAFGFGDGYDSALVITADTIVWLEDEVLPKPTGYDDAAGMLKKLSGNVHEVITGVTLKTKEKTRSFSSITKVWFKKLTKEEIEYYVSNYKPYDKAGAYGIQEWIGFAAVEKIEGSYFNVVGLPVQKVYAELLDFIR